MGKLDLAIRLWWFFVGLMGFIALLIIILNLSKWHRQGPPF